MAESVTSYQLSALPKYGAIYREGERFLLLS